MRSSLGLPCQHDCDDYIQNRRRLPFVLDDFHPYWHIVQESTLVQDAKKIGKYTPRIDPREFFHIEEEVETSTAPRINNPYLEEPSEASIRENDSPTILNPARKAKIGRVTTVRPSQTDGTIASLPRSQQPSATERLQGVVPPQDIYAPTASTQRVRSAHENVEKPKTIRKCGACKKPGHNKNSRKCEKGNEARLLQMVSSSQTAEQRSLSTLQQSRSQATMQGVVPSSSFAGYQHVIRPLASTSSLLLATASQTSHASIPFMSMPPPPLAMTQPRIDTQGRQQWTMQ